MESTTLKVSGMTCGGCVRSVTRVLLEVPGVAGAEVSLERAEAVVTFDAARTTVAALKGAIDDAGFQAG